MRQVNISRMPRENAYGQRNRLWLKCSDTSYGYFAIPLMVKTSDSGYGCDSGYGYSPRFAISIMRKTKGYNRKHNAKTVGGNHKRRKRHVGVTASGMQETGAECGFYRKRYGYNRGRTVKT